MDRELMDVRDELAVRNVVARLALFADGGAIAEYVDLYTDDAEWLLPGVPLHGRAEISAASMARRAAGQTGPGSYTRHVVSTTAVTVSGDLATAESYWQFFTGTRESPHLHSIGHYLDHLVRTDSGWRVSRRVITPG